MAAVSKATGSAVSPATDYSPWSSREVNTPTGEPASETYPGAIETNHAQSLGPPQPFSGPVLGAQAENPFESDGLWLGDGAGYTQGLPAYEDHHAPTSVWDSSAGAPFAGSGAIAPNHTADTGEVYYHEHVTPAEIGKPWRRTISSLLFDRLANTQDTIGQKAPGDRVSLDEYQGNAHKGYDPHVVPYKPRVNYANLAAVPVPLTAVESPYVPSGALPDMANMQADQAVPYQAPPDPAVASSSQDYGNQIGAEWL